MIGLIGKGGFSKEVYASIIRDRIRKSSLVRIVNDVDGTLQQTLLEKRYMYLLCIGEPKIRRKIYETYGITLHNSHISKLSNFIDISSIVLGDGSIVCAGSTLTCNIKTGVSTIININCTIGHDVKVGDFVTISPGSNISGNCIIGDNVSIGSNTVIRENIVIGNDVTIGMGSVVTKDISEPGIYIGNPCRKLK